ncbi:YeeE/YedE family protein [Aureivirga marina]|uniref:YeeE/YedE family protein n=1 Tax=Aureivirga marina TaxID=1182451 RepID=UPI0018C95447|nr:YeeE/YedE thiosulfate transporter family protein [Aureivirga marina]
MEIIFQPWPWYTTGLMIAAVMFLLFYFGKRFGVSSNLETLCTMAGASKVSNYFKIDLKSKYWSLLFLFGIVLGGAIAFYFLSPNKTIDLNPKTVTELQALHFDNAGATYLPSELFGSITSLKTILILLFGGFLVGFGARYAGGCTSGHAITGISNLDVLSLYAVIGFFVGGLIMIWGIFPLLF